MHSDGEVGVARQPEKQVPSTLCRRFSGHKLEDVKAASTGPPLVSVYLIGGREAAKAPLNGAHCRLSALAHRRYSHGRQTRTRPANGMKQLLASALLPKRAFFPIFCASSLAASFLPMRSSETGKLVIPGQGPMEMIDVGAALSHAGASWKTCDGYDRSGLGDCAKGVLTGDDARRAVDEGVLRSLFQTMGDGNWIACLRRCARFRKSWMPLATGASPHGWGRAPG